MCLSRYYSNVLLCFYLLLIYQISVIKSKEFRFETSSNASQFIDLENLIGSFHTHAPRSSQLFVRNMGLTDGQEKLLKLYENIRIIPSIYVHLKSIETINVDHEFILINNILSNRYNQKKYIFINFIRKKFFLAIVIPFIESQIKQLNTQLDLYKTYPPCRNSSKSIDLIFYSNSKTLHPFNYFHSCYQNIYHISTVLLESENHYPGGSAYMWKRLFIDDQNNSISLRSRGYTHFFIMEPDTRPIRSYWLDVIVEQITQGRDRESYHSTKWWMIGSIYRGTVPIERNFVHVNGNALYHLSYDFIEFIENVSVEFPYNSKISNGYDLDLFVYLFNHIDLAKKFWHKFQFSDFIQNCWHSGCNDTTEEFINNNPNTYLIHGYEIQKNQHETSSKNLYYFILLGFILVILIRSQFCRHRKFFCKRNCSDIYNKIIFFR